VSRWFTLAVSEAQGELEATVRINPNLQSAKNALAAIHSQGKTK
jgi:hypothetical protein